MRLNRPLGQISGSPDRAPRVMLNECHREGLKSLDLARTVWFLQARLRGKRGKMAGVRLWRKFRRC